MSSLPGWFRPHSTHVRPATVRTLAWACALWSAVSACGGGGGGGGGNPQASNDLLGLGVGASTAVDALAVTFEARAPGLESLALISPGTVQAVEFQGSHYVLDIPLSAGAQQLAFRGHFSDGRDVEQTVELVNAATPSNAVRPIFQPSVCAAGSFVIALIQVRDDVAPPTHALIDLDGDAHPDQRVVFDELVTVTAPGVGAHTPRVSVRLPNGLWLASAPESPAMLTCLSGSGAAQVAAWLPGETVDELADDPLSDGLLALSSSSAVIRHLARDGSTTATTVLAGAATPSGFCVDAAGDWFVADSSADRVRRYDSAAGWQLDASFGTNGELGTSGAAPGELDAPADVAITIDPRDDSIHVWVADSGNRRVQVFDTSGAVLRVILGSEEGGTAFVSPTRLQSFGDGIAVLDSGASMVRVFDARGNPSLSWGQGVPPSSVVLASPADLALDDESGALALLDTQARRVYFVDTFGGLQREFEAPPDARSLCFTRRDAGVRIAIGASAPSGIAVFDIQSDAPGQSPSEIVSDAISKLLAGDDAHALELFDESLAGFVATVLADPPSRAEFLAAIGQLTAPSEIERREPYAQVETGSTTGGSALAWVLRRQSGSGPWRIHSF